MFGAVGFRFRRRCPIGGGPPHHSSHPNLEADEGRLAIETHTNNESTPCIPLFRRRRRSNNIRLNIGIALLLIVAIIIGHLPTPSIIIAIAKNIKRPLTNNPRIRARVFNPLRYFHAAFIDRRPSGRDARSYPTGWKRIRH